MTVHQYQDLRDSAAGLNACHAIDSQSIDTYTRTPTTNACIVWTAFRAASADSILAYSIQYTATFVWAVLSYTSESVQTNKTLTEADFITSRILANYTRATSIQSGVRIEQCASHQLIYGHGHTAQTRTEYKTQNTLLCAQTRKYFPLSMHSGKRFFYCSCLRRRYDYFKSKVETNLLNASAAEQKPQKGQKIQWKTNNKMEQMKEMFLSKFRPCKKEKQKPPETISGERSEECAYEQCCVYLVIVECVALRMVMCEAISWRYSFDEFRILVHLMFHQWQTQNENSAWAILVFNICHI